MPIRPNRTVWRPHRDIPLSFAPQRLTTGDFNNDNFPDLVIDHHNASNRFMDVVLSNGSGGYLAPVPFTLASVSNSGEVAEFARDFDNDGKLDIRVYIHGLSPITQGSIKFYKGIGDGTFAAPITNVNIRQPCDLGRGYRGRKWRR